MSPWSGVRFSPLAGFVWHWLYILRGSNGRHYIGSSVDLDTCFAQHERAHTHTTKRLGENLEQVASKNVETLNEARKIERIPKG
ncbi:MAG: hypothetical protein DME50_02060 [Verrucomicrobia bacterium]|nr:MAG: hypothetical protein DME50_02060 [Verrucomicrobiota bacterium]